MRKYGMGGAEAKAETKADTKAAEPAAAEKEAVAAEA